MKLFATVCFAALATLGGAQAATGNAQAGRDLVTRSCTVCHAPENARIATDGAPPLAVLARNNRERPAWVRGWLMAPHPPMPQISLSRQQIDDVIAYLDTLAEP